MTADNTHNEAFAKAVSIILGGTFSQPHESNNAYYYITLKDGTTFSIRMGGWALKGRISIGDAYPKYRSGEGEHDYRQCIQRDFDRSLSYQDQGFDGITVADTKSPEQVAKDIIRRFLPTYTPLYQMALVYCQQQSAYWAKRGTTKEQIAAALRGRSGYSVRNWYADSACIEVYTVTPEIALKLAELLPLR